MNNGSIPKQVLQAMKQIGAETVKEGVGAVAQIGNTIITGQELLGGITPMSDGEMQRKQTEDERRKQEETGRIRSEMGQGRDVGGEIKQIQDEKKKKEEEEERQFLENLKRQREEERKEREAMMAQEAEGGHKKKGPQQQGKRKPSMVDQSMEQAKKPD